jgi:hypothetical protein
MFIEVRGNYIVRDNHTRELRSEFNPGQPQEPETILPGARL